MSSPVIDQANGCELPEDLRRYYLDTMGIQLWQEAETSDQSRQPWSVLEQAVEDCILCPLHKTRTQTVFGTGNQNADLMVIGEGPGHDEDMQGEPFVGEAGQLLTAMLAAIDLKREDVYIANIVKCRPPGNRNPESEEIGSCYSYLQQQIQLVQPRVIFAVGKVAAQALLNSTQSIGVMRERQHDYEGIPLIASYHPAYLLRKPSEKRKAWEDMKQLKGLLESCQ